MLLILSAGSELSARSLDGLEVTIQNERRIEISLTLSEALPEIPSSFTIDNPARIAIDLPETNVRLKEKTVPLKTSHTESIVVIEALDRTRVVINMLELVPYRLSTDSNRIILTHSDRCS